MLKNPLAWLGLVVLIGLVAIWDFNPEDLMRPVPEREAEFPHAYLIGSETRRFDTEGRLYHHMVSERADHFQHLPQRSSERDYSLIQKPDLTLYGQGDQENADPPETESAGAAPWRVMAEQGRSDANATRIHLHEDVRVWQEGDEGLTELTTSELIIEPDRQFAETDKAVNMRSPQGRNEAVGMRANLGHDHIELLSEVRGTYDAQDREP